MRTLNILAIAAALLATGTGLARTTPDEPQRTQAEAPKVYHAGGRHDQRLHEAAERARANGHRMPQATMHAGGRHDVRAHEAAIKADASRAATRSGGDAAR